MGRVKIILQSDREADADPCVIEQADVAFAVKILLAVPAADLGETRDSQVDLLIVE
jgi:hypothetical protein